MEILNEFELEKMIKLEKGRKYMRDDISDETLRKFLGYYDFLNNLINLVSRKDKEKIIYNKYYWYTKYKKRYFEVYGYNAGIEQEGFKLLEQIENELEEGVNWAIIQQIEESEQ